MLLHNFKLCDVCLKIISENRSIMEPYSDIFYLEARLVPVLCPKDTACLIRLPDSILHVILYSVVFFSFQIYHR